MITHRFHIAGKLLTSALCLMEIDINHASTVKICVHGYYNLHLHFIL